MSGTGLVTVYANIVTIMLSVGIFVLAKRLKMKDRREKEIFLFMVLVVLFMSFVYLLCCMRDERVFPCTPMGAMVIETAIELLIDVFAMAWFLYLDYRMFHSIDHLKRNVRLFTIPCLLLCTLDVLNIFTGILFWFDEDLVSHDTWLYTVSDFIRLSYFILSLMILEIHKRREKRMKFFSVKPFLIPMLFYGLRDQTQDVDLHVNEDAFSILKNTQQLILLDEERRHYAIGEDVELYVMPQSEIVYAVHDGICVQTPQAVLALKKRLNREKDKTDIAALEEYIKMHE